MFPNVCMHIYDVPKVIFVTGACVPFMDNKHQWVGDLLYCLITHYLGTILHILHILHACSVPGAA